MKATVRRRLAQTAIAAGFAVMSVGFIAAPASASTFTVTNANASGTGSLTKAIDDANNHAGADNIVFAASTNGHAMVANTTVEGGGALTIKGNGAGVTLVTGEIDINSGNSETTTAIVSGVSVGDFNVNSGSGSTTTATISNADVTGGGIDVNSGFGNSKTTASFTNVVVTGTSGVNVNAGQSTTNATFTAVTINGINQTALESNESNVTITGSTISNDDTGIDANASTLHITNSTITGLDGDAVLAEQGSTTLQNVTITNNRESAIDLSSSTAATVGNSIMVGNNNGSGECNIGDGSSITSKGGNLSDDATCNPGSSDHKNNTHAKLGALASNGGPTKTQLPLTGSAAIDGGVAAGCPKTDQRGVSRPQDGDHNGTAICDIGAVEVAGVAVTTTTAAASVTTAAATTPTTVAAAAATPTTVAAAAELPRTGSSSGPLAWMGACLAAAGGALVLTTRKRRATN